MSQFRPRLFHVVLGQNLKEEEEEEDVMEASSREIGGDRSRRPVNGSIFFLECFPAHSLAGIIQRVLVQNVRFAILNFFLPDSVRYI